LVFRLRPVHLYDFDEAGSYATALKKSLESQTPAPRYLLDRDGFQPSDELTLSKVCQTRSRPTRRSATGPVSSHLQDFGQVHAVSRSVELFVNASANAVELLDLKSGQAKTTAHTHPIERIAFGDDGALFITVEAPPLMQFDAIVVRYKDGNFVRTVMVDSAVGKIRSSAINSDGSSIVL
jgi:hypothetical protein